MINVRYFHSSRSFFPSIDIELPTAHDLQVKIRGKTVSTRLTVDPLHKYHSLPRSRELRRLSSMFKEFKQSQLLSLPRLHEHICICVNHNEQ